MMKVEFERVFGESFDNETNLTERSTFEVNNMDELIDYIHDYYNNDNYHYVEIDNTRLIGNNSEVIFVECFNNDYYPIYDSYELFYNED